MVSVLDAGLFLDADMVGIVYAYFVYIWMMPS